MPNDSIQLHAPKDKLTPREQEVLTLTAQGKRRSEIAEALSISEETVKVYVERVCRKLNASNKTHAATIALLLGLIEPYASLAAIIQDENDDPVPRTGNAQARRASLLPRSGSGRKQN